MCVSRRLNGRFVFIFIPYLPCWTASQLSWLMPPQVLHFFVTGITPAVSKIIFLIELKSNVNQLQAIESLLRYFDVGLIHSAFAQTLIFMISSVVVLHYQQTRKYSGFWFIRPTSLTEDHKEETIFKRMIQGLRELRSYLGIGIVLDLINPIMKRNLKVLRPKMTSFLTGYIGLFKVIIIYISLEMLIYCIFFSACTITSV